MSGYSIKVQGAKALFMLQAYVDDSASDDGDQRLFLAGYINTADKWMRFSSAWQEELDSPPSIQYLRMAEANNLSGEFRGWKAEARDEKLRGLSRVIRHFEPASIHSSISRTEFKSIISPVAPYGFNRPYFYCFQAIIVPLAHSMIEHGLPKVPVDFIFDEQGPVGDEAKFFYRMIREAQPAAVRSVLSKDPIFRNDKLVLPLQAADMLAWHVRRNYLRDPNAFQVPDFLSADGLHMCVDCDAVWLKRIAERYASIPGTQKIKTKGAWRRTMQVVKQTSDDNIIQRQRPVRVRIAIWSWRRRVAAFLSRFVARFLRKR